MIPAFEAIVCRTAEARAEFEDVCADVFSTTKGKRLLHILCSAAHPLEHTPGLTDHEHGRREVVATLWRFGAQTAALPASTQSTPTP